MSSRRFPGKVLAPFRGTPLVAHVVAAARAVGGIRRVVVATSTERSDDPLAAFLDAEGIPVFRGPLDDVFARFRAYVEGSDCDWILRVSADSPLLDSTVLRRLLDHPDQERSDLVTTTYPRTFPRGQNGELIRASTLLSIDPAELTPEDREHVTPFYYRHPERFRIAGVRSTQPPGAVSLAVDTVEDLLRLERSTGSAIAGERAR